MDFLPRPLVECTKKMYAARGAFHRRNARDGVADFGAEPNPDSLCHLPCHHLRRNPVPLDPLPLDTKFPDQRLPVQHRKPPRVRARCLLTRGQPGREPAPGGTLDGGQHAASPCTTLKNDIFQGHALLRVDVVPEQGTNSIGGPVKSL